jgi:hypothetical protein
VIGRSDHVVRGAHGPQRCLEAGLRSSGRHVDQMPRSTKTSRSTSG